MTTPAAGDIPASDVTRRLRRPLRTGGAMFAISLAFAGWGFAEWRQERVLDDGPRAEAEVVDTDHRRRRPGVVVVRYQVDGRPYEEELPADTDGLEPGDRIQVIYDPGDPSHARPARGWSPAFQFLWIVAAGVAVGALGVASLDRRQARAAVRALDTGSMKRMWLCHFRRSMWRGGYQHLAALWRSESAPPADQKPDLVVEVDSRDGKHLENGPVVVHGSPEPGGRAVLRVAGRTVWPHGKSRSELPKDAEQA